MSTETLGTTSLEITEERLGSSGLSRVTARHPAMPPFVDTFNLAKSREREKFAKALEDRYTGLEPDEIRDQLDELAATSGASADAEKPKGSKPSRESLLAEADSQAEESLKAMSPGAVRAAELLLEDPTLINLTLQDIGSLGVVGEEELALTSYLLGTSRLLEKPLAAIVQGTSSSGKSFVPERVSALFPPSCVLKATDMTPNALYYLPTGRLMHRFVLAGERPRAVDDERANATRALREMLASGELRKVIPLKSKNGSALETQEIWQPGPISYIESTTVMQVFDEDENRCLMLSTDESAEQTTRIVEEQARRATGVSPSDVGILAKHHALQLLLRRVEVIVPFAPDLARKIPKHRQEARRAMPMILAVIRAVALLHQRQRTSTALSHGDAIRATFDDYVIARRLLTGPMGRALGGALPNAVANFGRRLRDRYGSDPFTSTRAEQDDRTLVKSKVNEYLLSMANAGLAECLESAKGSKPATWKMVGDVPPAGALWLPLVRDLEGGIS